MNSPVFRKSSLRQCGFTGFMPSSFFASFQAPSGGRRGISSTDEEQLNTVQFSSVHLINTDEKIIEDQPVLSKLVRDNSCRYYSNL
ncbi:MAG: hypothetical protein ACRC41_14690 [Sarcina sp.]